MTLEDFFTLTEMKDGLIVPARVEELIAVMKTEDACILKNAGDAMRQWSTVATVMAVTENKDCLDLFIRSDGLVYIDRWLKDAQTFSGDSNDSLIEESILALLHALEKLGIGNEKLTSSGIYLTLRDLLSHKSKNIQERAKAFLEHFIPPTVSGEVKLDSEGQTVPDGMSQRENSIIAGSDAPKSSSDISPDQKADVNQHVHQLVENIASSSGGGVNQRPEGVEAVVKEPDKLANHFSECNLKEVNDKVEYSVRKEACSSERKSRSDSPDTEQGIDMKREVSGSGSLLEIANAEVHTENLPDKLDKAEVNHVSKSYVLETDGNAGRGTGTHGVSADLSTGEISTRADHRGVLVNCTATLAQKTSSQGDESSTGTSQDSSDDGSMLRNSLDMDNTYPQSDNVKHDPSHLRGSWGIEQSIGKSVDVTSKSSAMDLEYGMVDALEVACLVAKEVERQVAEEEQFGSFPKKRSIVDSFNGEKDEHAHENPLNEPPVEKMSGEDSSGEDVPSLKSDNTDAAQENDTRVVVSSQVTGIAPEAAKGTSEFDLNLDICSEAAEDNASKSVSNPVAVVSASRAVAVPGLPASPLKFEGALGWKGSAATSAFRPASQRRTDEVVTNNTSREGHDFVFDLNLAEDDESLAEPSPRKPEKLSFDLNLMSEEGDAPFSPSLKPSSPMNFDLNDKPLNFNDTSDLLPFLGMPSSHQFNSYGGSSDNSAISIMGAKMKQSGTTFLHQAPISFFNGRRTSEPLGPAAMSGPPPPLAPSFYSYNGITVGPGMSFSPQMYGPGGSAAYMVDPRVMGGAPPSAFQAPFAVQPSFTTNMVGPLPGPNGVSSFRPHLGFNPGFVVDGGSNRVDGGGFRQLFPGQVRSAEGQLQPLFPGIGGKRKEPDGGWEFHQPPPHL